MDLQPSRYSNPAIVLVVRPAKCSDAEDLIYSLEQRMVEGSLRASGRECTLGVAILYNLCNETIIRQMLQIPESKRIVQGANARLLYNAMRCYANDELTIMLVGPNEFEIFPKMKCRTLHLSMLEKSVELNHTDRNKKEPMQSRSSAPRPLKILPQFYA